MLSNKQKTGGWWAELFIRGSVAGLCLWETCTASRRGGLSLWRSSAKLKCMGRGFCWKFRDKAGIVDHVPSEPKVLRELEVRWGHGTEAAAWLKVYCWARPASHCWAWHPGDVQQNNLFLVAYFSLLKHKQYVKFNLEDFQSFNNHYFR